jgi:hypothetical protein
MPPGGRSRSPRSWSTRCANGKLACPKGELNLAFPNGEANVERHANIHTRGLARAQFTAGLTTNSARPKYGLGTGWSFCARSRRGGPICP